MSLREWFRDRRRATWPRFWGVSPIVADSPRVSGNLLPCVCVAPSTYAHREIRRNDPGASVEHSKMSADEWRRIEESLP